VVIGTAFARVGMGRPAHCTAEASELNRLRDVVKRLEREQEELRKRSFAQKRGALLGGNAGCSRPTARPQQEKTCPSAFFVGCCRSAFEVFA
jgi:hypothetical protein